MLSTGTPHIARGVERVSRAAGGATLTMMSRRKSTRMQRQGASVVLAGARADLGRFGPQHGHPQEWRRASDRCEKDRATAVAKDQGGVPDQGDAGDLACVRLALAQQLVGRGGSPGGHRRGRRCSSWGSASSIVLLGTFGAYLNLCNASGCSVARRFQRPGLRGLYANASEHVLFRRWHGRDILKFLSATQQAEAQSSGDSEWYALVRTASVSIGLGNLAKGLGLEDGLRLAGDVKDRASPWSRSNPTLQVRRL